MGLCAGLASAKLALLSGSGAAGRTTDSEQLFCAELFFHDRNIVVQTHVQEWSILNSCGNLEYPAVLLFCGN